MTRFYKVTIFFLCVVCALYTAFLLYLTQNYGEGRWIPKKVLTLPKMVVEQVANQKGTHLKDENAPSIRAAEENVLGFQVLFDNSPLPVVNVDNAWGVGVNALKDYARPVSDDESKPKMAILLTDVGLNDDLFISAVQKLPPVVTLSFSPYALDLLDKIRYARQNGFENMMDVVVQSLDGLDNGGALAVRSNMSALEICRLLQEAYFDLNVPFIGFWLSADTPVDMSVWQDVVDKSVAPFGLAQLSPQTAGLTLQGDLNEQNVLSLLEKAKSSIIDNKNDFIVSLPMHPVVLKALVEWGGMQVHPEISLVPVSNLMEDKNGLSRRNDEEN